MVVVDSVAPMPSFDDIDEIVSATGKLAEPTGGEMDNAKACVPVPCMFVSCLLRVLVHEFIFSFFSALLSRSNDVYVKLMLVRILTSV